MAVAWHEFADRTQLDQTLAKAVASCLTEQIGERGDAVAAFSGGSTPVGMFQQLSVQPLNWAKVAVTLVDERFVPPEHGDSNERLLRENLLQQAATGASLLPMYLPGAVEDAAVAFAAGLSNRLPFAAVVLGMGGDGHTASWFPDSPELAAVTDQEAVSLAAAVTTPSSPHARITLTLPAVLRSKRMFLHLTGAEKRQVLERNLSGETAEPVAVLLKQAGVTVDVYWAP